MHWFLDLLNSDPISSFSYLFGFLALLSIWCFKKPIMWQLFFVLSILFGVSAARIEPIALIAVAGFWLIVKSLSRQQMNTRFVLEVVVLILAISFIRHKIPGFINWQMVDSVRISAQSTKYSFFWNIDSLLAAILLLAYTMDIAENRHQWRHAFQAVYVVLPIAIFGMLILVWALGFVRFELKLPNFWPAWILENLLIVSVSQEVIYRGFFLQRLKNYLPGKFGTIFALITTSFFFAYIHAGPISYLLLCFVAGLFYGASYLYYRKIESAILVHFLFNLAHLLFFSYPAYQA